MARLAMTARKIRPSFGTRPSVTSYCVVVTARAKLRLIRT